jgi:hypothetical protein
MAKKGKGAYKGKHWMQLPENREKVIELARRRAGLKKLAHKMVKKAKRSYVRKPRLEATTLVVNGWRVTLGNGEIRIDHE